MLASLVGFYTIPLFQKILPMYKSTPTDKIIINCAIFLIFSSALPVSSKILGLTRFDLLGHFGDLNWLSNVNIILIYNFSFAVATGISLFTKFTSKLRTELYSRILILFQSSRKVNWRDIKIWTKYYYCTDGLKKISSTHFICILILNYDYEQIFIIIFFIVKFLVTCKVKAMYKKKLL